MTTASPLGLSLKDYRVLGRNGFQLGPLTCHIAPGHFAGLLGPAQSGKSLLLAALSGLVPHKGQQDFGVGDAEPPPNVQLIFQEGGLLENQKIAANLSLAQEAFGPADISAHREILDRLGIAQTPNLFPRELSGGMRKRVLLARALLCRPQILLIDHVTAGLDPQNAQKLKTLVLEIKKELGFTLLWVTHEPGIMLPHLDQVLLLQEGQLTFDGNQKIASNAQTLRPYFQA